MGWSSISRTKRRLVVLSVIIVVVGGGVGWVIHRVDQIDDRLPQFTLDLASVCDSDGHAYSTAPAHTGPAPHPIEVFASADDLAGATQDLGGLQNAQAAPAWDVLNPNQIQLVACALRTSVGGKLKSCPYYYDDGSDSYLNSLKPDTGPDVTFTMYAADYRITIYEVRTHNQIAQLTLPGTDSSCPDSVDVSNDDNDSDDNSTAANLGDDYTGPTDLFAQLTQLQLRQKLAGYLGG